MWALLRRTFGSCKDRWRHDWQEYGQSDEYGIGGNRKCLVCGKQQVCIGCYQLDGDLNRIRQWETIEV